MIRASWVIHMFPEEDCLPISALQHLLFCPRQCALIHVEQQWAENRLTLEGGHLHEKTDRGRASRRGGRETTRSMPLRSLRWGIFGKADVVEFEGGVPLPVEYKRGKPKKDGSDRVQLCAQALCLEEMLGTAVPSGAIFYGITRRREPVMFDAALRGQTLDAIRRLHEMIGSGITPIARREKKCHRCSLLRLCMPEVLSGGESASRYLQRSLGLAHAAIGPSSDPDLLNLATS